MGGADNFVERSGKAFILESSGMLEEGGKLIFESNKQLPNDPVIGRGSPCEAAEILKHQKEASPVNLSEYGMITLRPNPSSGSDGPIK